LLAATAPAADKPQPNKTWINGVAAADLKDSITPKGFFALQVHGVGAKETAKEVRYRNIRLQELP
jgi:hypothetical protein